MDDVDRTMGVSTKYNLEPRTRIGNNRDERGRGGGMKRHERGGAGRREGRDTADPGGRDVQRRKP